VFRGTGRGVADLRALLLWTRVQCKGNKVALKRQRSISLTPTKHALTSEDLTQVQMPLKHSESDRYHQQHIGVSLGASACKHGSLMAVYFYKFLDFQKTAEDISV